MQDFLNYLILGLTRGSLYALITLSYTLIYSVLQLINFTHSEVFMSKTFGSYLVVNATVNNNLSPPQYKIVAIITIRLTSSAIVNTGLAWTLERMAYRPLQHRKAPKLAFLISAIDASFFLSQLFNKLFNRLNNNNFPSYFDQNKHVINIDNVYITLMQTIIMVSTILMILFLNALVSRTKLEQSIRTVAKDTPTTALIKININKTISRTFMISSALGKTAGFLYGSALVFSNTMEFIPSVKTFAAAVLNSIGNIHSAMLNGLLLSVVEATLPTAPWYKPEWIGVQQTDVITFLMLVLMLIIRPTGILNEHLERAA